MTRMRLLCSTLLLAGCGAWQRPQIDIALTPPSVLCPGIDAGTLCLPVAKLDRLLRDAEVNVLQARRTSSGTNGTLTLWLGFPKDDIVIKAKWKEAARGGSAINNQPRKELAAYALQKLFLDPDEYVVPPTQSRCIPLAAYKAEIRPTKPTFAGSDCAYGVLAYWLDGVKDFPGFDKRRFEADLAYRETIANVNVFTYLFDHRDTRPSNFLITKRDDQPRVFSIDNGLALDGLTNPRTAFRREWRHIFVPKLPSRLVDRLRKITRADLDTLATVAEFAIDGKQLDPIANTDAFVDKDGVRRKGNVIQLGLTKKEIDGIEHRIHSLLERVDQNELEEY